ncbi:hypothetical protein METH109765_03475 [Mesobacillus thioparans]
MKGMMDKDTEKGQISVRHEDDDGQKHREGTDFIPS